MQFGEHDVVVASTNNESFQEISRSGTVLFDGPNDATTVALVATSNGSQDVSVMTPDVCEIKRKMEVSLEDTPKPRAALFQEGNNDEPMASQNVFDAQDTHKNISKPRTALFQGREVDETMARQVIQFGSFSFDAKQNVMKAGNIDFTATMPNSIIFRGANLSKEKELCQFKKPPDI